MLWMRARVARGRRQPIKIARSGTSPSNFPSGSPGWCARSYGWRVAGRVWPVRPVRGELRPLQQDYGSIAVVIIFLVWLWITNLVILIGAEFNAELERGRAVTDGVPLGQEPYVKPRDLRKLRKKKRS